MIYLTAATDTLKLTRSSAAAVDVQANYIDAATATLAISGSGRELNAFNTAATGTFLSAPGSSTTRTLKQMTARNKDASLACNITIIFDANGTQYEIHKVTLNPGETLEYIEGVGFFTLLASTARSGLKNVSTADQSIGASATAYLTGSAIALPYPVVAGMVLRWTVQLAKTGAATATETVAVRFGTGGSTSDTARNSFTGDTETAAADEAVDTVVATIRGPIGASCIVEAVWQRENNLSTTGFSNTARKSQVRQATSAAFDITTVGMIAGLSIATGASHALTVRQVMAELLYTGG